MIGLRASGFTVVSCFGGGLVRLGRPLRFMLGFSAGAVCVSERGERGRGVFPSAAVVVVAVIGLFVQRRLCVCVPYWWFPCVWHFGNPVYGYGSSKGRRWALFVLCVL